MIAQNRVSLSSAASLLLLHHHYRYHNIHPYHPHHRQHHRHLLSRLHPKNHSSRTTPPFSTFTSSLTMTDIMVLPEAAPFSHPRWPTLIDTRDPMSAQSRAPASTPLCSVSLPDLLHHPHRYLNLHHYHRYHNQYHRPPPPRLHPRIHSSPAAPSSSTSAFLPVMTDIMIIRDEVVSPSRPRRPTHINARDPSPTVVCAPSHDSRPHLGTSTDHRLNAEASCSGKRPLPNVIQGHDSPVLSPLRSSPTGDSPLEQPLPILAVPAAPDLASARPSSESASPPSSIASKHHNTFVQSPSPLRAAHATSFSGTLMAGNNDSRASRQTILSPNADMTAFSPEVHDEVMDIEACIDNPILAPLGRHVNKRRSPKRSDQGHIDINVVNPSSPATFKREQERESHVPVTSLILRRRRLDCAQLDSYLQNLQPTFDLGTTRLQSPLLHLTELDLSRNRLSSLPENMTTLVPFLSYLNLAHNQFTEIPLELCQLTYIQVLIMSQNRIEGPVPHQICSSLTQLKTLRLCANQITSLPHSLARLDKLESLSMGSVYGGNLLTSFPANCIQYMSALRELDLSHNKLCFLPADIGHPKSHLRQLSASDNKLEAIPKSIGHCRELRSLNLGRNQLTSLPTEIADLNQLDTLDLSENLLCVIPGDVADFLTKTTLLLTGNPFTRGYCDANRNPVSEIGGLGINYPTDEDRYAAMLKSLSRRAILNSAASTSSSAHTPTLSSLAAGRESPRLTPPGESGYEMDQDERLDYHLYYTRHALASRPPSRAESVSSSNETAGYGSDYGSSHGGSWADPLGSGTRASTPRVNVEAVLSDIDSYFDFIPSINSNSNINAMTTTISSSTTMVEPSIFEGASLSPPSLVVSPTPMPTPQRLPSGPTNEQGQCGQIAFPSPSFESSKSPMVSPVVGLLPTTTPTPGFFPSLKELAARAVLHQGEPLPLEYIPEVVVEYLEPGARPCGFCRGPYVKEWVSSVRVKSYLGHPAVARRVRFCSAACWRTASEQLDAEEAGNIVPSAAAPGSTTGHLPPVVTTDGDSRGSSREEDLDVTMVDSTLSSPTTHSAPSSPLTTPMSPWTQGMRVCKGGQTYWPVIGRQRRGRTLSSGLSSPLSVSPSTKLSVDESASIAKTNVCSGGCLVRGVCEW